MQKIKQDLILKLDVKNNIINLLVSQNKSIVNASLLTEKISGNIFCESVYYSNICNILKKVKQNKQTINKLKIVLPQDFFNIEIIKLNNTLKNNIFVKNEILTNILNFNDYYINFKKWQIDKNFVYYNVCYIKKWVINSIEKIQKIFNINSVQIISSNIAQTEFFNNNFFKESSFSFLKFIENNCELKVVNKGVVCKDLFFKNIKNSNLNNNFALICKNLNLNNFYNEKQYMYEQNYKKESLETILKHINLLKQNNTKVIVFSEDETIFNLLKTYSSLEFLNFNKIAGKYKNIKDFDLVGALNMQNQFNLQVFNLNKLNTLKNKCLHTLVNVKLYCKFLFNKLTIKNKNIIIKEDK